MGAALAPVQGPTQYLADDASVAAAKADFQAAFATAEAGDHALLAPKPVEALPAPVIKPLAAPVAVAASPVYTYYNSYYSGYNGYYPYNYGGYYPYSYGGVYPYNAYVPYTVVAAPEAEAE